MNYHCYGLHMASDIALPELAPAASGIRPDLHIRRAAVAEDGLRGGHPIGPCIWAGERELWLQVPRVARFLVREGREILVEAEPGVDEDSVRVFLLGTAFGGLLFQRGYLVLHGNAVRIGNDCLVCVGHSGAGKSTLAAAFMQRGFDVVADDVVPVDEHCRALPGFPRIKLWQDAADRLGIVTTRLLRLRPALAKFSLPVSRSDSDTPLPIRWVYVLDSQVSPEIVLRPLPGIGRFRHLHSNTYRRRFLDSASLRAAHLEHCGRLAAQARVVEVLRSKQGFDVDGLVDCILGDIERHPPGRP